MICTAMTLSPNQSLLSLQENRFFNRKTNTTKPWLFTHHNNSKSDTKYFMMKYVHLTFSAPCSLKVSRISCSGVSPFWGASFRTQMSNEQQTADMKPTTERKSHGTNIITRQTYISKTKSGDQHFVTLKYQSPVSELTDAWGWSCPNAIYILT